MLTDALDTYYTGSRVKVRFSGANPRNNLRLEDTYLTVDRLVNGSRWQVVATDGNWETMSVRKWDNLPENRLTDGSPFFKQVHLESK